jgi:hypothetical protein
MVRRFLVAAALASGLTPCVAQGTAKTPLPLTQPRINEFAAALDRVVRALVDDTGLRRPQEPLPTYLNRIAIPLPKETPSQYVSRTEGYLRSLEQASQATAPLRRLPPIQDTNPANRARWRRLTHTLSLLPRRIAKLRAAWKRESRHSPKPVPKTLGQEFAQTLNIVLSARDGLRDARP